MAILNPWVSSLKVWIVFCLGNNFLFKSILTGCVLLLPHPDGQVTLVPSHILQFPLGNVVRQRT